MYSLKDTVVHCFWYFVSGLMDVVKTVAEHWTWWHTAAALIPVVPGLIISELTGFTFTTTMVQYLAAWWLLNIADDIYEEEYADAKF